MAPDLLSFIEDVRTTLGAGAPELFTDESPAPRPGTLAEPGIYLIGLIGGKDVGKSSIINALAGREISARTSYGPGTEQVIAYVHEAAQHEAQLLLERLVPGHFRIVTHREDTLRRQALLDLPDIDSHYASHLAITRKMLRHMLFPLWVQSVEKYADHRPRELLSKVAEGNSPRNFLFCLNKVDQVLARGRPGDAAELRDDFARRIAQQLSLHAPPRVWMISALEPDLHDLPELRRLLGSGKSDPVLQEARSLAEERQDQTLLNWVDQQNLDQRSAALQRLEETAREELAAAVSSRLLDSAIPAIQDDPAFRLTLADQTMDRRIAKWPIVNIVHVLLGPVVSLLRRRLPIEQQIGLAGSSRLAELHLSESNAGGTRGIAASIQTVFARLQQLSPLIGRLYTHRKLWEPMSAASAEADLIQRFSATLERQRALAQRHLAPGSGLWPVWRWLLTIGPLLWFPFLQPLLEAMLQDAAAKSTREIVLLAVQVLGTTFLLKNVGFLLIYFLILWLILRWHTHRRIERWILRCRQNLDATLSLSHQALEWSDDLLAPISSASMRMKDLAQQAKVLREQLQRQHATRRSVTASEERPTLSGAS